MSIVERLRERIERGGPMAFSDFMEAALYDPEEGYYGRGGRVGEGGDFVTSPTLGPAFARAIARRFAGDARYFGRRVDFVEAGAGRGAFLRDLRGALEEVSSKVAGRTRFRALERSAPSRRTLEGLGFSCVDVDSLAPVGGWIFSNELFDAQPSDCLLGTESGAVELAVGWRESRFVWVSRPARAELLDYLAQYGISLETGQRTEISRRAPLLYRQLARALQKGRIVTIDYGHRTSARFHSFARPRGTLAVHSRGRLGGDPLENPGAVDLTTHVHWDALVEAGEAEGLSTDGLFRQGRFLLASGILDDFAADAESRAPTGAPASRVEALRAYRLIDPEGMGEEFCVLVQSRGMPLLDASRKG